VLAEAHDDEEELGIRLLGDLKQIFHSSGAERVSTADLLAALAAEEDSPWADWHGKPLTTRGLGRFLSPYGIRPNTVRLADGTTPKGYKVESFEDAWKRYVPEKPSLSATTPQPASVNGLKPVSIRHTIPLVADAKQSANPHGSSDVADVADKKRGNRGRGTEADRSGSVRGTESSAPRGT